MKKKLFLFAIVISIVTKAQIHVGSGQTYATLGVAVSAKVISAGDTVYIHAGTYHGGEWIADSLQGTPSQWITIRPYKNDSVSITAQWTFLKAHYLKITGLNWDGTDVSNIGHMLFFNYNYNCFGNLTNIIVDNCKFMNDMQPTLVSYAMIKFTGTDTFQVLNCTFKNSTNIGDGISSNGGHNGTIKNCRFENLNCWASHCKGGSENITYEKNMILNCAGGGIVMGGDTGGPYYCTPGPTYEATGIHVYSNITVGGSFGIRLASCSNSDVINNTCYNMTSFAMRLLWESSNSPNFINNNIYNNIFASNDPYDCYINASAVDFSTFYFKNNLFWSLNSTITAPNFEWGTIPSLNVSGSIISDPKFVDAANNDFSLQATSPAKGAAFAVGFPYTDYNGDNFNWSTRSIGAIEYAGLIGIKDYEDANDISVYPNPSNGIFNISWTGAGSIKKLHVYNVMGQLVYSEVPSTYLIKLDLNNVMKGLYKVVLTTNKGTQTNKTLAIN